MLAQKVALAHLNIWEKALEFEEKIKSLQKVAKNSIFWENKIIMEKVTNFLVKRKQNLITIRKNPNQKQTFQTNWKQFERKSKPASRFATTDNNRATITEGIKESEKFE